MKDKNWEAVHEVFIRMEDLCKVLKQSGTGVQRADGVNSEIVRVRSDIRTQLEFLRVGFSGHLTERESFLVLFPIVIYFDELVQYKYLGAGQHWPMLQKELYEIDDGGILFYDTLDDILRKPQTLPFIYEVFYFCLSHGFRGRYNDDPVKISEYMKRVAEKIIVKTVSPGEQFSGESVRIKKFISPMWYYAGAMVLVGLCFLILKFAGINYVKAIG